MLASSSLLLLLLLLRLGYVRTGTVAYLWQKVHWNLNVAALRAVCTYTISFERTTCTVLYCTARRPKKIRARLDKGKLDASENSQNPSATMACVRSCLILVLILVQYTYCTDEEATSIAWPHGPYFAGIQTCWITTCQRSSPWRNHALVNVLLEGLLQASLLPQKIQLKRTSATTQRRIPMLLGVAINPDFKTPS